MYTFMNLFSSDFLPNFIKHNLCSKTIIQKDAHDLRHPSLSEVSRESSPPRPGKLTAQSRYRCAAFPVHEWLAPRGGGSRIYWSDRGAEKLDFSCRTFSPKLRPYNSWLDRCRYHLIASPFNLLRVASPPPDSRHRLWCNYRGGRWTTNLLESLSASVSGLST